MRNEDVDEHDEQSNLVEVEHGRLGFLLKRLQPGFHPAVVQVDVLQYLNLNSVEVRCQVYLSTYRC